MALLLVASISTFAQDNQERKGRSGNEQRSPEERSEARMKKMTSHLMLNESQQTQMKKLYADQMASMKGRDRNDQNTTSREERQQKRAANKLEMDNKVKSILTAEQFSKYSAMQDSNNKRRQGNRKNKDKMEQ